MFLSTKVKKKLCSLMSLCVYILPYNNTSLSPGWHRKGIKTILKPYNALCKKSNIDEKHLCLPSARQSDIHSSQSPYPMSGKTSNYMYNHLECIESSHWTAFNVPHRYYSQSKYLKDLPLRRNSWSFIPREKTETRHNSLWCSYNRYLH